jgi:hypothetical protein
MKTISDKKKQAEYLRQILNEEVLCGKLDAIKIIRDGDGSYEIQTDEWKGKPFNYDTLQILQDMGSIDIHNSHEIDERPYRRALFYKHFNDRLAGLHLKDQIKQMETE